MNKLTTDRLEKFVNDIKNDGMCDITDHQVALALRQLLAYEQAAKNPIAWVATDSEGFPEYNGHNEFSAGSGVGTPLYAAPVLPKQPEPTISFYRDGLMAAANWVENQRVAYDNEHGQFDSETGSFEFGNDAQLEYSTTLLEIAEGIRSLHPAAALALPLVSFDELMAAVSEVTGVNREFDATPEKCYQAVPFMNFNSLSRIVEMFRTAQPEMPRWPADEVERDALRYRFLRDKDFFGDEDEPGLVGWEELVELSYNELDAAVDARIAHPDIDYVKLDTALRKHIPAQPVSEPYKLPSGWKLVPIEPTENMIIDGFESEPDKTFSKPEVWEEYAAMSGCKQAAHRAKLCWAAMLAAAPVVQETNND